MRFNGLTEDRRQQGLFLDVQRGCVAGEEERLSSVNPTQVKVVAPHRDFHRVGIVEFAGIQRGDHHRFRPSRAIQIAPKRHHVFVVGHLHVTMVGPCDEIGVHAFCAGSQESDGECYCAYKPYGRAAGV